MPGAVEEDGRGVESLTIRRLRRKRREIVDRLVVERDRQKARALVREIGEIESAIAQTREREANEQEGIP